MNFENTLEFAKNLDKNDPLKDYRDQFYIPVLNGKECIYFCGNSLGLQPKIAQESVLNELEDWANFGVEGYLHSRQPWMHASEAVGNDLAPIAGALPEEIVIMHQLTVNLHLLLTTFYQPNKDRYKIICEEKTFPSDQYAIHSQLNLAGYSIEDALLVIKPRQGEYTIHTQDIISAIKDCGNELAVVIIGGVNYYTGQAFEMEEITAAAHEVGAKCGFDLAHAIGNVELKLHDWDVDFACWCSYKYLNSGPGGVGGAFIHQRYVTDKSLMRLAGWWGNNNETKFLMKDVFEAAPTAIGWQLSMTPVLGLALQKASLEIINKAGFKNLLDKSKILSAYLFFVLNEINNLSERKIFEIITPNQKDEHGSQVSLFMIENGNHLFDVLRKNGVVADWREPNVIRLAPVPLYNTFEEVFTFGQILKNGIAV